MAAVAHAASACNDLIQLSSIPSQLEIFTFPTPWLLALTKVHRKRYDILKRVGNMGDEIIAARQRAVVPTKIHEDTDR